MRKPALSWTIYALTAIAAITSSAAHAAPPQVVASIAPVHSLVASVMAGVASPRLLISPQASPHAYSLRPSDAGVLADADVVFWVGRGLEPFLAKAVDIVGAKARRVALADADGVTLLPLRTTSSFQDMAAAATHEGAEHEGAEHEGAEHEHDADGDHDADTFADAGEGGHHHHDSGGIDPHVWLDPDNAKAMADAIAATLSQVDPPNGGRYMANAASLKQSLDQLATDVSATLAPDQGRPFIVLHDAYQYFGRAFGLDPVAALTIDPEIPPSARQVSAVAAMLDGQVDCIFVEPQFERPIVNRIAEETGARVGQLDPLGADLAPGPQQYATMMRNIALAMHGCLSQP